MLLAARTDVIAPCTDLVAADADMVMPCHDEVATSPDAVEPRTDVVSPRCDSVPTDPDLVAPDLQELGARRDDVGPRLDVVLPVGDEIVLSHEQIRARRDEVRAGPDVVLPRGGKILPRRAYHGSKSAGTGSPPVLDGLAPPIHPLPRERTEGAPMPDENPNRCTVRCGKLTRLTPPESLVVAQTICTSGAQSGAVQGSPIAQAALGELAASVQEAQGLLQAKMNLVTALRGAISALNAGMADVRRKLAVYEGAVDSIADGNMAVINEAGLDARAIKPPPAQLEPVKSVRSRPGKTSSWAVLSWPAAAGAGSYAVGVNFNPTTPDGPWTTFTAASNRSRAVQAPAAGAQFLARVASVGRDGTQSDWSPTILVTAR